MTATIKVITMDFPEPATTSPIPPDTASADVAETEAVSEDAECETAHRKPVPEEELENDPSILLGYN